MEPAIAADIPASAPGDEAITCQQIAAALAPYAQQMGALVQPMVQTEQQLVARSQAQMAEAAAQAGGHLRRRAGDFGRSERPVKQGIRSGRSRVSAPGMVTVVRTAGRPLYTGSSRNGIQSSDYGVFSDSIRFEVR